MSLFRQPRLPLRHTLVWGEWIGTRDVYRNSPCSDVNKSRLCTQRILLCSKLSFLFLLSIEPGSERDAQHCQGCKLNVTQLTTLLALMYCWDVWMFVVEVSLLQFDKHNPLPPPCLSGSGWSGRRWASICAEDIFGFTVFLDCLNTFPDRLPH